MYGEWLAKFDIKIKVWDNVSILREYWTKEKIVFNSADLHRILAIINRIKFDCLFSYAGFLKYRNNNFKRM